MLHGLHERGCAGALKTLKPLIPDDDYEALLPEKERTDLILQEKPRVQVRFRLAELLGLGQAGFNNAEPAKRCPLTT